MESPVAEDYGLEEEDEPPEEEDEPPDEEQKLPAKKLDFNTAVTDPF